MQLMIEDIKDIIANLKTAAEKNKDHLIKLDAALGDGDLGLTMKKAFTAAADEIEDFQDSDIGTVLKKIGFTIANEAAATMGTLTASAFIEAGKEVQDKEKLDYENIVALSSSAVEGIKKRGKAEVGDKTVLDSLMPAQKALSQAFEEGKSLEEGLEKAVEAARKGVEKTKEMSSKHGRAHYYRDKSQGKKDPGAVAGYIFLQAISESVLEISSSNMK